MNNASDVKSANLSSILREIHRRGAVSKGNIAASLGLTTVTVNKLVAGLCADGICAESGEYVSYGGRKAALYKINPAYGAIPGAALTRTGVYFTLHDFALGKLWEEFVPAAPDDVSGTVRLVAEKLAETSARCARRGVNVIGAGVSIPGRAGADGAVIDIPEYPQWNSVPLGKILSDSTGIPVLVDNDANSLATASMWGGLAGDMRDFIYMKVDEGVGVGVVIDGELFRGSSCRGSELGHMVIDPDGELCRCGRRGCVQTYIGEGALLGRISRAVGHTVDYDEAIELYRAGDEGAVGAVGRFMTYLRITVGNAVRIFDPEGIILQNRLVAEFPELSGQLCGELPDGSSEDPGARGRARVRLMRDGSVADSAAACIVYDRFIGAPPLGAKGNI